MLLTDIGKILDLNRVVIAMNANEETSQQHDLHNTISLGCLLFILCVLLLTFQAKAQDTNLPIHNQAPFQEAPFQEAPFKIELCDGAIKAGFSQHNHYLLNPRDFQVLELQHIVRPYISRLNRRLEVQGTDLITLVLPPRSILFPELSPSIQNGYDRLVWSLESSGLNTILIDQILETYETDFFFEYDHHWTPVAAREVAKVIGTNMTIDAEWQQRYNSVQADFNWSPYNSRLISLSTLCGIDYVARANTTNPQEHETGYLSSWTTTLSPSEGLFDNREARYREPSVLLGTSNSESSTLNFAGFLSEYTGLSISNYSFSSSGALGSMLHYFLSDEYQDSKPPYIFWEFLANPHTTNFNLNSIRHYRQIIPSISGSCEESSLARAKFQLKEESPRLYLSLFENQDIIRTINGSTYYLSFDIVGDFLERLIIDIQYNTGHIDQSSLHMLPPSGGMQRAYLEFLDSINGQVNSIHVNFPKNSTLDSQSTTINVNLCSTARF